MPATIHLHPTNDAAPRALLPGDPGRALALAQSLLDAPLMFNHNRGLWGYTGRAADGEPLTIQSTGIGGPSAAIVVAELAALGVQRMVRVGTARALAEAVGLGELVVVREAVDDRGERVEPDLALAGALSGDHAGLVASTDDFYGAEEPGGGALARDMESAAVLRAAARHGVRAASVLIVTAANGTRLDAEAYAAAGERVGAAGAAALLG